MAPLVQKIAEELTQPEALLDLEKFVQTLLLKAMRQTGDVGAKLRNVHRLSMLSADVAGAINATPPAPATPQQPQPEPKAPAKK